MCLDCKGHILALITGHCFHACARQTQVDGLAFCPLLSRALLPYFSRSNVVIAPYTARSDYQTVAQRALVLGRVQAPSIKSRRMIKDILQSPKVVIFLSIFFLLVFVTF